MNAISRGKELLLQCGDVSKVKSVDCLLFLSHPWSLPRQLSIVCHFAQEGQLLVLPARDVYAMLELNPSVPGRFNGKIHGKLTEKTKKKRKEEKRQLMRAFPIPQEWIAAQSLTKKEIKQKANTGKVHRTMTIYGVLYPLLEDGQIDLDGEAIVLIDHNRLMELRLIQWPQTPTLEDISPGSKVCC